jgi:dTDP-4-dehydrorhamnose reductase
MRDRWLVTGGSGQLGGSIAEIANATGYDWIYPPRSELDLSDPSSITSAMNAHRPDGVINCAAYTAVDKAESEPELAFKVNAIAPKILAEECAKRAIPIIHVSTDYVFDGRKTEPYVEDDPIGPLGVYGTSKEQGESAVRLSGAQHAIVRTAWLLNPTGSNFLTTMLRLGNDREELRIVSDQLGCPTSVKDLANALILIAQQLDDKSGTWHFVNSGSATWYELAAHIFKKVAARKDHVPILTPISTSEYPTAAQRPANSMLSTAKIESDFGIRPRSWQHAVDSILTEILEPG